MKPFDREMTVGGGSTDNTNKPTVDYLMTFNDYTVLVEIKRPDTQIFKTVRRGGGRSRAGTWEFSPEFTGAISQVIEQKAEWASFAERGGPHYSKDGSRKLVARTRNAKTILVIGSRSQFADAETTRDTDLMNDTFELFRREIRNIDIITFDELLDRAKFIAKSG